MDWGDLGRNHQRFVIFLTDFRLLLGLSKAMQDSQMSHVRFLVTLTILMSWLTVCPASLTYVSVEVHFMSGLMKSAMGFEVNMDDDFEHRISTILELLISNSSGVVKCELKNISEPNRWIIECLWHDQQAMHAHFLSCQLQNLIGLLASRSRKIVFECGSV